MKSNEQVVEAIKARAKTDVVFNAMCVVFAERIRTRSDIAVSSLIQKMKVKGFKDFTKDQYVDCLRFMADLDLGIISKSPRGKVKRLKNISVDLKSIGEVALTDSTAITIAPQVVKFTKLKGSKPKLVPKVALVPKSVEVKTDSVAPMFYANSPSKAVVQMGLTVVLEGKPFTINIPEGTEMNGLVQLINKIRA